MRGVAPGGAANKGEGEARTVADSRFFTRKGPFSLGFLALQIGASLRDPETEALTICDVATLDSAVPGDLSVFSDPRYRSVLDAARASAIVTSTALAPQIPCSIPLLIAKDPRLAYAQIGALFYPPEPLEPGIDRAARIDPTATIGAGSRIDSGVVIEARVEIGERCHIAANAVIGRGVVIGNDSRIGANSVISHAIIGAGVDIASCVSIGVQGFGFVPSAKGLVRMQQLGRVIIGDRVEIGANTAIDRGATDDTVIGAGTVIDNLVQIGHNVRIGKHCVLSGQSGVAGSTIIGDGVMIGGGTSVSDHLTVGAGARIAGKSGVARDVDAGQVVGGYPAVPMRQWLRQSATLNRLTHREKTKPEAAD